MDAIVLVENGKLEYQKRPIPQPQDSEYLVRMTSTGVCNSDIFRGFDKGAYHYPLVMGHEMAGEIVASGPDMNKYQIGQKVVVFPLIPCRKCGACQQQRWVHCTSYDYYGSRRDGGFQQFLTVKEWNLLPIPEGIDDVMACLCEPIAVCLRTANMLSLGGKRGTVAVIGAGIIGIITAMILKTRQGYEDVSMIDRNTFKLDLVRELGMEGIHLEDISAYQKSFDYVVEACGAVTTYYASLDIAAPQAVVVWMGNIQGDITFQKSGISSILRKELIIRGVWNSEYQQGVKDDWICALELIKNAPWLKKLITHEIALSSLPHILEQMYLLKRQHSPHNILKVIIKF